MSLGIYVHLPFCRVHCSYCPFVVSTNVGQQDRYTDALRREIDARGGGEVVDTIFFGGGTPSRTSAENLTRIVARLRDRFAIAEDAEFSMEANPEDVTPQSIAAWRALGVNRISIGVQSLHDDELRPLGRVHGPQRACDAIRDAVTSGVRTSLDLILGLPHQTATSFRQTLQIAIDSGAGHLSLYMLDLEEGTALKRQVEQGKVELPDDDLVASLYADAVESLARAGLTQYEISNFGDPCRHNLRYWRREEYLGLGAGAHSFVEGRRFANTRDVGRYIDAFVTPSVSEGPGGAGGAPPTPPAPSLTLGMTTVEFVETLSEADIRRETIFLRLRQTSGIDYDDVVRLCGAGGLEWIERGLTDGWLRREGARVAFTSSGFLLSNDYISQLF
jgi:oxygen-independent coproporphyrinogen-3 oxidase